MDDQTVDECGICLETLNTAVTLPCNHKFCASCLDGWKSKFASILRVKEKKSKSCPLCREKIPPSKDMMIQLDYHRTKKRELEEKGETSSKYYLNHLEQIKRLEEEIGDYDGEGLDYEVCMELPKHIFEAVMDNDSKRVLDWLGTPVDMKRLNARYPGHMNAALVHAAAAIGSTDLLSILLQYGADVNVLDARGCSPLTVAHQRMVNDTGGLEKAKILLEWGAEIILPRDVKTAVQDNNVEFSDKDVVATIIKKAGNIKLGNLISSEFGGRRCEVINLPNHPQLNGKACVVEKYIAKKDRYKIIFEGSGNAALVGPNNLKRRDRTPLDCGYYITFKNGKMSRREFATKEECQEYVASLGSSEDVEGTAKELSSLML